MPLACAYHPDHTPKEAPVSDVSRRLRHVLAGQRFPAQRWELISRAEDYGADARSRGELWALPAKEFRSLAEVLGTIDGDQSRRAPDGGRAAPGAVRVAS
jgi:hypothetical protein